jgi:DNA-binding transcriptional LysR family regulator
VSRLVSHLETRLGGALIDRSTRPLRLTTLGQVYYEGCKSLLDQYIELEASLLRDHAQMSVTVRVAAIYSVGLWDMGQYVERCESTFPHARVHIDYVHPDVVYERINEGVADLGLVSFPSRSKDLTVLPWREEEMVVVCSPQHSLAGLKSIPPARLNGEKYVAFDRGLVIRSKVDRFLRGQEVTIDVVLEFDNIENIKKGIEFGAGLALLPEPMIRQERQAGTLLAIPLEGCRMVRPLGIIHRRQHRLCNAAMGFIELLTANGAGHETKKNGEERNGHAHHGPNHQAIADDELTSSGTPTPAAPGNNRRRS